MSNGIRWYKRQRTTQAGWVERVQIILWVNRDRTTIAETAQRRACRRDKVLFWRRRFVEGRTAKFPVAERRHDRPRSGPPRVCSPAERKAVALSTRAHSQAPTPAPRARRGDRASQPGTVLRASGRVLCTRRDWAAEVSRPDGGRSISHRTIVRIWHERDWKPWCWQGGLHSPEPEPVPKSRAICRLSLHPPEDGTLLCLDEKPGVQILERLAPDQPGWPGRVAWHFLPTHASWLNQIEIWYSVFSRKSLKGGSWRSYAELQSPILTFMRTYHRRWAHPYYWTYKDLPLTD